MSGLRLLYADVGREAARLETVHAERLRCRRGCADCCVDRITVFEVEAQRIRHGHAGLLANGRPAPEGRCAFLDEDGACRIYDDRPYVCRTQGLPLRWLEQADDGTTVEYRDICPLNEQGPALERLPVEDCWTIGDFEGRLAELQRVAGDGTMRRVALRSLFSCSL